MQWTWYHRGYSVTVRAQQGSGFGQAVAGFLAIITVSLSSGPLPVFPSLSLGDDNGGGFTSEHDAIVAGVNAANRVLDDLLD